MAASPRYKVYNDDDEYIASFKYIEDAAYFVGGMAAGYSVRLAHTKKSIIWLEGNETIDAHESYDQASSIMAERERLTIQQR